MKILFITQLLPWPVRSGGRFKTSAILKQLGKKHQVHLVCFHDYPGNSYQKNLITLKKYCGLANAVSFFRPEVTAPIKKMWMLVPTTILSHKPFIITKYFDLRLRNYIEKISTQISFDVIYLDHDTSFQYLQYVHRRSGTKVIYDEHNVNSVAMWRSVVSQKRRTLYKGLYLWDYFRFRRYEKQICKSVDAIAAISSVDRQLLLNQSGNRKNIKVLPLPFAPISKALDPADDVITFVGVLSWGPNRFGFHWFYQQVWPQIIRYSPKVKLNLIGARITSDTLDMIQSDPTVNYLGEVANLDKWYRKTKVFVVPIWMGSGIRIKLLDAMAHGLAIVSTTIGAEGVVNKNSAPSAGIQLADNPKLFANEIIALLNSHNKRLKAGELAKKYIKQHYTSKHTQQILQSLLK